jgi:acetyl-CoA acetyltransferase
VHRQTRAPDPGKETALAATAANLIGSACTPFGKLSGKTYPALAEQVAAGALRDCGLSDGLQIDEIWFGNCTLHRGAQPNLRGQACLARLQRDALLPAAVPIVNVENACATGASALYGAIGSVLCGRADLVLVLGVEKLFPDDGSRPDLSLFDAGLNQLEPADWMEYYEATATQLGRSFRSAADRSIAMDTYALQACWHMQEHGTTQRHLAVAAVQSHRNAAENPLAQYRFKLSVDEVLGDRDVSWPLTRSMCAPISDGAAALVVCSDRWLNQRRGPVRERAVRVRACEWTGGRLRHPREPSLSFAAARRAYTTAGIEPRSISVAEVHDATSFSLIYQAEMMGFCESGDGGPFIASGATALDGRIPLNPSGGLIGKGHPVGATGIAMIHELMLQLRGEAGSRQVRDASIGLAENGGGVIGFDEAVCIVTLLDRRQ